jgi:hypothetical protein
MKASHQIYSIYLNTIIRDLVFGEVEIAYDPDYSKLRNQLSLYEHILSKDIVYNKLTDLNRIDIFPHYKQFLTDPVMKRLITSLINILMPEDIVTDGSIVHTKEYLDQMRN